MEFRTENKDARRDALKVLLAAPLPPPDHGGIVRWTRIIREEFQKCPAASLAFVDTTVRYRSATTRSLAIRLVGGSAQAIRDTCRVYGQLKRNRPNVLHLCTSGGPASLKDMLILRIAKWFRVPSLIHYRMGRLPSIIARAGMEWKATRQAMRLADVVVVLDRESEDCVKAALPEVNVTRLPNVVELDTIDRICSEEPAPSPCARGSIRLVFAGHVIPAKGVRELVEACVRLSDSRLVLEIIGPAQHGFKKELERIAAQMRNGDWLRLLGPVKHEESIRHIAAADMFILPSHTEGMPNVVLEAMACGRTILSTTVGAVPEMLDIGGPEECGVCVPAKDMGALAEAIRMLSDNGKRRAELGARARRRAERLYSVPVGCAQLLDLWRSLSK
jgi:glycosyltransferase involved in cell wall biosynthesis